MKEFLLNLIGNSDASGKFDYSAKKFYYVFFSWVAIMLGPVLVWVVIEYAQDQIVTLAGILCTYYGGLAIYYAKNYRDGKRVDSDFLSGPIE